MFKYIYLKLTSNYQVGNYYLEVCIIELADSYVSYQLSRKSQFFLTIKFSLLINEGSIDVLRLILRSA